MSDARKLNLFVVSILAAGYCKCLIGTAEYINVPTTTAAILGSDDLEDDCKNNSSFYSELERNETTQFDYYNYLDDYGNDFDDENCTNITTTDVIDSNTQGIGYYLPRQQKRLQQNYQKPMIPVCVRNLGWPCKFIDTCGHAPLNHLNGGYLITGGHDAAPGQWPFYAAIFTYGQFTCSGSIVSEHHILTARHCMQKWDLSPMDYKDIKVLVGTNVHLKSLHPQYLHRIQDDQYAKIMPILTHIYQPNSDLDSLWLFTEEPIQFNQYVQPICYPFDHLQRQKDWLVPFDEKHLCYNFGGGVDLNKKDKSPDYLKYMRSKWTPCIENDTIAYERRICFDGINQRDFIGSGDSGSAIACLNQKTNRWQLAGVVYAYNNFTKYGSATSLDTALAQAISDWPEIHVCERDMGGSSVCNVQHRCDTDPKIEADGSINQPQLVRIDKVPHDSMRDGGSPCPGVLVSYDLVLTDRNCTMVRYKKRNLLDIAPLDSLRVTLNIYYVERGQIIVTTGKSNDGGIYGKLKVDEIYVLRKFNRNLIMLRLERDLDRDFKGNAKHPICWPYDRSKILWENCFMIRLAEPHHCVYYLVRKKVCPEGKSPWRPEFILSCWEFDAAANQTQPKFDNKTLDVWTAGSPIACYDHKLRVTLVAIIKESHITWAMGASILSDDIDMSHWWREIIRHGQPKATKVF